MFIVGLIRMSNKESKASILIGEIGISRYMANIPQVQEEKLRDIEELKNKRSKTRNESGQQTLI